MKQVLLIFLGLLAFDALNAQALVGTGLTPRHAVLEEFTGIKCDKCPQGHAKAETLYTNNPGKVNIINIHPTGSSLTAPSAGQPDLRTSLGPALQVMAGTTAAPTGMMNRQYWPGAAQTAPYYPYGTTNYGMVRDGFIPTGQNVLASGNADVNIGVKTTWNATSRILTVDVELYYTVAQTVDNEINVAFLQNNIIGHQASVSGNMSNYNHKHVLRDLLTGQWGEVITTPALGQLITKTYTYTVPASYNGITCNIDNCDITVFVSKNTHQDIHTGITCKAKDDQATTTPLSTNINENFTCLSDVSVYPNPLNDRSLVQFSLASAEKTTIELYNVLGSQISIKDFGCLSAGTHNFSWNFITKEIVLSKGVYLLKINAEVNSTTLKVTL